MKNPFKTSAIQEALGNIKKHWLKIILSLLLILSLVTNGLLFQMIQGRNKTEAKAQNALETAQNTPDLNINTADSITQIEQYLDSISPSYLADEQYLAKADGIPSWGCGPSSYSLAKILDAKFFNNQLKIASAYDTDTVSPNEIVERFALHEDDKGTIIDHAWLEIYYQNTFLFIDPTIGQFGKINKIAYQQFSIGDPNITDELKSQYGTVDIRLSRLVQKQVNRIPADQEPYPGVSVSQDVLNYYIQVEEDRNDVNNGKEPADWTIWDQYLISRYT
jgi:hypothetical protein